MKKTKVYAIVRTVGCDDFTEPEGIYASKARADAVCLDLNLESRYAVYNVFEYELNMQELHHLSSAVEQRVDNALVSGSIPLDGTKFLGVV